MDDHRSALRRRVYGHRNGVVFLICTEVVERQKFSPKRQPVDGRRLDNTRLGAFNRESSFPLGGLRR